MSSYQILFSGEYHNQGCLSLGHGAASLEPKTPMYLMGLPFPNCWAPGPQKNDTKSFIQGKLGFLYYFGSHL